MKQFVEVVVEGKDIAPYLYGNSARLFIKDHSFTVSNLLVIKDSVPSEQELFGVELKAIRHYREARAGNKLMRLSVLTSGIVQKEVLEVLSIEQAAKNTSWRNSGKFICARVVFPDAFKDIEEKILTERLIMIDRKLLHGQLYLHYSAGAPANGNIQPFFNKILNFAADLRLLIECWSIAENPEIAEKNLKIFTPYESYWERNFLRKHGNKFNHSLIWYELSRVLFDYRLDGINRIYDNSSDNGRLETDLITPLLDRMQNDIVEKLIKNKKAAGEILTRRRLSVWKRRVKAIFGRHYTANGLSDPFWIKKNFEIIEKITDQYEHEWEKENIRAISKHIVGLVGIYC